MFRLKSLLNEIDHKVWIDSKRKLIGNYEFQGHLSDQKNISLKNEDDFTEDDVEPLYNQPPGFWTSTVIKNLETFITDWIDYHIGDEYFHGFTVVNDPDILRIRTSYEYNQAIRKYGETYKEIVKGFDWVEISNDYDAVHVSDYALNQEPLEWWSTESTLWFRPKGHLKHQFTWEIDLDEIPDVVKDNPQPPV